MSLSIAGVVFNLARNRETETTFAGLSGSSAVRYILGIFQTKKNGLPASRSVRRFEIDRIVTSDGSSKVGTTSIALSIEYPDANGIQDVDAVKAFMVARFADAAFWSGLKAGTIEDTITP